MDERPYSNAYDGVPLSLMDSCQLEKLRQGYAIIFVQSSPVTERDTGSSSCQRRCLLYRLPCEGTSNCNIYVRDMYLTSLRQFKTKR